MNRSSEVRELLKRRTTPMTVREICDALAYPYVHAKRVSSILVGWEKTGEVVVRPGLICSVSHRKATGYEYNSAEKGSSQDTSARRLRDEVARARLMFARLTGYKGKDLAEMAHYYERCISLLGSEQRVLLDEAWRVLRGGKPPDDGVRSA